MSNWFDDFKKSWRKLPPNIQQDLLNDFLRQHGFDPDHPHCDVCGKHDVVLQTRIHHRIINCVIVFQMQQKQTLMCTECIRKDVLKQIPLDLICSHFIWPFIFVLTELPQFLYSYINEWRHRHR